MAVGTAQTAATLGGDTADGPTGRIAPGQSQSAADREGHRGDHRQVGPHRDRSRNARSRKPATVRWYSGTVSRNESWP